MSGGKYDSLKDKIFNAFRVMKESLDAHVISGDHDDRYYQKSEADLLLGGKVDETTYTQDGNAIAAALNDKVNKVTGKALSTNDFTDPLKTKLDGISVGAEVNPLTTASRTAMDVNVVLQAKAMSDHVSSDDHDDRYYTQSELDVLIPQLADDAVNAGHTHAWSQLTSVPATASRWPTWAEVTTKPSTFPPSAHNHDGLYYGQSQVDGFLSGKVDVVSGKGLTTNDFTDPLKTKLDGVSAGAEVNLPTTASRTSSATGTVLQAKAMNDHNASGDHDSRYYTKTTLNGYLDDKVDVADIVNALTSTDATKVLSAAQGKALKDQVDLIDALLQSDTTTLDSLQEIVNYIKLNRSDLDSLAISSIAGLQTALNDKVAKVSGKGLSANDFTNALKTKLDTLDLSATNYTHPGSSFSMTALNGATIISDINVDSTGHISNVATRSLAKADIGLSNVPNTDATDADNLSSGRVPTARLTGSYSIDVSGNANTASKLETTRTINGVAFNGASNITVYDATKVSKSGDTMTGRLNIGGSDDGVNELQVDGDASLRGNVGVNNSNPSHALDVDGDVRVRDGHAIKFGGTGANDAEFEIRYNPTTQSLDFNYLG